MAPSQLDHFLSLLACWFSLSFIKAIRAIKCLDAIIFSKYYLHLSVHFNPFPSEKYCLYSLPVFPLESTELCFALFRTAKSSCCTIALQPFIIVPNHSDVLMVWHIWSFPLSGAPMHDHALSEFSYRLFFPRFIHFLFLASPHPLTCKIYDFEAEHLSVYLIFPMISRCLLILNAITWTLTP